jgi:hypothetical protein
VEERLDGFAICIEATGLVWRLMTTETQVAAQGENDVAGVTGIDRDARRSL